MLINNKFASNTFWLICERVVQMILFLFVGTLSARYLGQYNYGILSYTLSIITIFTTISTLGIESVLIKELLNDPKKVGESIGSVLTMRFIASLLSILFIYVLIKFLNPDNNLVIIVCLLQSFSIVFKTFDVLNFWFQSKLISKYIVISKLIATIVVSIWKVSLLLIGTTVEWFALSVTIETLIISIVTINIYFKKGGQKFKFCRYKAKKLLSQGYHFILSGLLVVIYTQIDKIMLGKILDQSSVGVYSVATTVSNLWCFVPTAIITSATPLILQAKEISSNEFHRRLRQLYCTIFWFGVIVCTVLSIISKPLIYILYGSEYIAASQPMVIVIWSTIFALLGSARGIWIVGESLNKYTKYYVGIGAITNIILNYILIKGMGINGIAVSTLISQIMVALISPLVIKKTRISTKLMLEGIFFKNLNKEQGDLIYETKIKKNLLND